MRFSEQGASTRGWRCPLAEDHGAKAHTAPRAPRPHSLASPQRGRAAVTVPIGTNSTCHQCSPVTAPIPLSPRPADNTAPSLRGQRRGGPSPEGSPCPWVLRPPPGTRESSQRPPPQTPGSPPQPALPEAGGHRPLRPCPSGHNIPRLFLNPPPTPTLPLCHTPDRLALPSWLEPRTRRHTPVSWKTALKT